MKIQTIFKKSVRGQEAYPIETRAAAIRMDANENPHVLSPALRKELFEALSTLHLNRYPTPGSPSLRRRFAQMYHVDETMVVVGNGSDELIHMLLTATITSAGRGVMIPTPTFAMYRISALNTGHAVIEVPLDKKFDLPVDEMCEIIRTRRPELIFLSYPNNPTGNCFSRDRIEALIGASDGLVVVDEAYFNFSGNTFLPELKRYDNLVILRTLSKVGFAALRIGVLIAHPPVVHELNKVRLPYNLNLVSQSAAEFFFSHEGEFLSQTESIIAERARLLKEMRSIRNIRLYPTDSNFILFSCHRNKDGVYEKLLQRGILIKNFGNKGILKECLRVTVGTKSENGAFIRALKSIVTQ